jgi:hypothetical protein
MFLSINMISYGRNILSMDIELFIVRMPQAFKCYIASAFLVAAKES